MSARRRSWAVSVERAAGRPGGEAGPQREDVEAEQGPAVADAAAEDEEGDGPVPPAADRAAP
ncbi:hypothetical protein ACFXAF_30865 [Kitasatospora sp. NPDC059463]|uniref:hypothetical protein n=1 Tax=unclassified Kitasatospora TaxID=2633591 RepID=UPI0036C610AC